ncbi:MAG: hypothetical protein HYY06_32480 [Deltaproteobacteria bacterium]|nr:hypothetical protein [Deltaproteobacteria bacterium]
MIEFDLASVRADGWFERVGKEIGSFVPLCDAVGEKFVAFSIVAGVRITAITIDRRNPANTVVDFAVGESGTEQRLPLGEFRRRLVAALLGDDPTPPKLTKDLKPEELAAVIGSRYVLLAPLYGYALQRLAGEPGKDREARVAFSRNGTSDTLSLVELRDRLRSEVRRELNRAREGPFALDLNRVDQAAEAAARGNHAQVVELLGSWPGPLSLLLRTPAGAALGHDQRTLIAKGLMLLGAAYGEEGKLGWSEELYRLGLQYDNSGPMGASLFLHLARAMATADRFGEAIGPLRRALALGAAREEVFPHLGRAFLRRGKLVAAVACLENARAAGVSSPQVSTDLEEGYRRLGDAGQKLRAANGGSTADEPRATEPPPAPAAGSGE